MVDLNKRISNRRKKLKDTWTGKEWKEKREAFINGRGCQWCGSHEYLTVHHPYRNSYGRDLYLDFYLSQCVVLCRRCHAALHAGKVLCECKEHYRPFDAAECFACYSKKYPEVLEKVALAKEKKKREQKAYRHKKYLEAKKRHLNKYPKIKGVSKNKKVGKTDDK